MPVRGARASSLTTDTNGFVRYVVDSGEANRVQIMHSSDMIANVSDPGAVIRAHGQCRLLDPHTAVCDGFAQSGEVMAGDMNNMVSADGFTFFGDGGRAMTR
jgi:hypothetical protein